MWICDVHFWIVAHYRLQLTKQDIDIERETYQTSRAGLDSLVAEAKKRLEDETQTRIVSISVNNFSTTTNLVLLPDKQETVD